MEVTARTFYYFFELHLAGVPEPVTYETTKEDVERLSSVLDRLEDSPEDEHANENSYFYFTTPDRQQVVVHMPDLQAVQILIDRKLHEVRRRHLYSLPRLWVYLRGRPAPIVEVLDDEDAGDHYSLLAVDHFDSASSEDSYLPKMLSYLNSEGDRCYLNRRHLMMWVIDWDCRASLTTVFEADGTYVTEEETGVWRIQAWRLQALFADDIEPSLEEWYASVEFVPDDQDEILYEFDTYGPYATKSMAVSAAQADFESGRYMNHIIQLREPGSLDDEEV